MPFKLPVFPKRPAQAAGELPHLDLIREAMTHLEAISEVGQILLETESAEAAYREVITRACAELRAQVGLLFLWESRQRALLLVAAHGLPEGDYVVPETLALGEGLSGWVAENRRPFVTNDMGAERQFQVASMLNYKRASAISVPILYRTDLQGVLTFCDERVDAFAQTDLLTAQALASSLALGLRVNTLREESQGHYIAGIQGLINALEAKDPTTQGHSLRIAHLCREVGAALGLPRERQETLETAARLHDIGKIGVPEQVLNKPSALDGEEWRMVRRHPEVGAEILRGIPALREVAQFVAAHHEHLDGTGYPRGLVGDEIPLESRVIAVADAFDAMVSARPYRGAMTEERALAQLRSGAGAQFDARAVAVLIDLLQHKTLSHFYGLGAGTPALETEEDASAG